ncbi:beta-galactosidase [uncultured Sphingomonas sp.]|uniref:beta-galactosidase n=1 Tax=uncultured Sphingomonas sp. TaxID=158754 RepID=UPI00262B83E2|nr:beta-galactosidase [uncultured Sphingomonas sp.]
MTVFRPWYVASMLSLLAATSANAQPDRPVKLDTILYGTAYYNEYVPAPIREGRLEKDISLMKQAGITVVRMGESTWATWEPVEGRIDFAWMDKVVAAMGKAGIKVILGTPTYSIPVWMYAKHPDMLARPLGGGETSYGMRQNMNIDDSNYRRYAERIVVALARHYRDNPTVIGWQLDNETSAYGSSNPGVHRDFVEWLKARYKTTQALNDAWLLTYWGQNVDSWENMPTRDRANNPSLKLAWSRFQQYRASRFIAWQAGLVRANARSDQFIFQNHTHQTEAEVDAHDMDKPLDVTGTDIYFDWQDGYDGWTQTFQGDLARSIKKRNYFVVETNAQTIGWDAKRQLPPYDGQMYQDVFTDISNGANMVSYWHWASLHNGQEIYWKGVLGHDLKPNRSYAEVSRVGAALKRVGSDLVDLKRKNDVAILYSVDSMNALSFMPYGDPNYVGVMRQFHRTLYDANVGTDFVAADDADFTGYRLLIVPALYVADDALLEKIRVFVRQGGHVIMTFKSGVSDGESMVRTDTAPGPLRDVAGISYQEVSTLTKPLPFKGDPFKVGGGNAATTIAEFLKLEGAQELARYDHPFFGQWPAVTRHGYGKGSLVYEGTVVDDKVQAAIITNELKQLGLYGKDQQLPARVRIKHATSRRGSPMHFIFNYSSDALNVPYGYGAARDLLTGQALAPGASTVVPAWGVIIAQEEQGQKS